MNGQITWKYERAYFGVIVTYSDHRWNVDFDFRFPAAGLHDLSKVVQVRPVFPISLPSHSPAPIRPRLRRLWSRILESTTIQAAQVQSEQPDRLRSEAKSSGQTGSASPKKLLQALLLPRRE